MEYKIRNSLLYRRVIKMTAHAKGRALERGINEVDIERVINSPIQTIYTEDEQNYKSYGLVKDFYSKKEHYLVIIHTRLNKYVKIISVMWGNKGALAKWFQ